MPRRSRTASAGVAGVRTASSRSAGPLPRAWPMARSSTTWPWRRTHSAIAGIEAAAVEALHPAQMRSMPAAVMPSAWTSPASAERARDRAEVARHPDAPQRVGHQRKARDRRGRRLPPARSRTPRAREQRDTCSDAERYVECRAHRSGRSDPLARAGLGSSRLARRSSWQRPACARSSWQRPASAAAPRQRARPGRAQSP